MSCPLAVVAPFLGARSETFIRRHMRDLLPGATAVAARVALPDSMPVDWTVGEPLLDLTPLVAARLRGQVVQATAQALGFRLDRMLMKRFLRRHGVRVILGEYLDFTLQWFEVAQDLGIPLFGHGHGYDVSSLLREARWRTEYLRYNQAGGVITISRSSREELVRIGVDPAKVHVVPCGADAGAEPVRRPERGEIVCVAVGRMCPQKAPILLLDSFRRAAEQRPRLRLEYIGGGPMFGAARDFVHALRLGDRVTLHNGQPNEVVLGALARADIFLQHSITDPETGDQEGLPVAILEAMARGLPVVSTLHAAIPEQVLDAESGYLVEPGDTVAMAERIVALADDGQLRSRMGLAAWKRVKEHFSWERERAQLLSILGLS